MSMPETEREFRGAGCTDACRVVKAFVPGRFGRSDLLLHDPDTHEAFARATAGPNGTGLLICTGPLVIDRWTRTVSIGDTEVALSLREWEVLEYLAERLGRTCLRTEIAHAIWGPYGESQHTLRVVMARLRSKLGTNGHTILRTVYGVGYRLVRRPPISEPEAAPTGPSRPWSLRWAACICCGRTDRRHHARGRCTGCQVRPAADPSQHYGPCGIPAAPEGDDR